MDFLKLFIFFNYLSLVVFSYNILKINLLNNILKQIDGGTLIFIKKTEVLNTDEKFYKLDESHLLSFDQFHENIDGKKENIKIIDLKNLGFSQFLAV